MGLTFKVQGEDSFEIDKIIYNEKRKLFIAKNISSGQTMEFAYPLESDKKYNTAVSDFDVYLFHKDTFATNDIYQVLHKKKNLGWLFPIQALLSAEHDFAKSIHFFPYSFNGYKYLLKNNGELPSKELDYSPAQSIEAIYGENTYLLVVYKKYLKEYKKQNALAFNIVDFLPWLYLHGFTFLNNDNFIQLVDFKKTSSDNKLIHDTTFEFKHLSKALQAESVYIASLIQGLLKLENHSLVKFHLLYSVIEMFITKVFDEEFKILVPQFSTSTDFYDSKEKLSKIAGEKGRLNKLFNQYTSSLDSNDLLNLQISCNDFLKFIYPDKDFDYNPQLALYKVRSTLFHNFKAVPKSYDLHLQKVNSVLEILILQMFVYFKTDFSKKKA